MFVVPSVPAQSNAKKNKTGLRCVSSCGEFEIAANVIHGNGEFEIAANVIHGHSELGGKLSSSIIVQTDMVLSGKWDSGRIGLLVTVRTRCLRLRLRLRLRDDRVTVVVLFLESLTVSKKKAISRSGRKQTGRKNQK